jgi:mannose-6-phosphate isomerase-like protein (cupin superfamily)
MEALRLPALSMARGSAALAGVRVLELPGNPEGQRQLTFVELEGAAPFPVRRIYWIHTLSEGEWRGQHAHKETQQLLVAVSGRLLIRLDDGTEKRDFVLDSPSRCLWVPAGLWRDIEVLEPNSVLLALASTHFNESDYIRDYAEYLRFSRTRELIGAAA